MDAELFVIGAADGVLSFKEDPDYDAPMDSDKDQSYHLIIQATDDEGASTIQELTIEIQDGPINRKLSMEMMQMFFDWMKIKTIFPLL